MPGRWPRGTSWGMLRRTLRSVRQDQVQVAELVPEVAGVQRVGEPVCEIGGVALHRGPQPAAFQDVNVLGRERTLVELFDAPALMPGHPHRCLQVRRKVPRRRVIELTGLGIPQPDPAGAQPQQIRDQAECPLQGLLHIGRTVKGFGDGVEDPQLPDVRILRTPRLLCGRCLTLVLRHASSWLSVPFACRPRLPLSRSEEHTSELQSRQYLVCRLLLEKKKNKQHVAPYTTQKSPTP